MSEQRTAGFYDWLCEHTDLDMAEYVMSCLASARVKELRL